MSTTDLAVASKKETIQKFFDSIAGRYDAINTVLSLRLDESWRKKSCDIVLEGSEKTLLDLGAGTGKFLRTFLKKKAWNLAVGLDFSSLMLQKARQETSPEAGWVSADFHDLPFRGEQFDLVISSFALRSVQELPKFFREIRRLLKARGKAALLCLTRPKNPVIRALAYPYLKFFLPVVGGWLSGNPSAYGFLSSSILTFQKPDVTAAMLQSEGFHEVAIHEFSFGLATLIIAKKSV